jgi:hypothetical protein
VTSVLPFPNESLATYILTRYSLNRLNLLFSFSILFLTDATDYCYSSAATVVIAPVVFLPSLNPARLTRCCFINFWVMLPGSSALSHPARRISTTRARACERNPAHLCLLVLQCQLHACVMHRQPQYTLLTCSPLFLAP